MKKQNVKITKALFLTGIKLYHKVYIVKKWKQ